MLIAVVYVNMWTYVEQPSPARFLQRDLENYLL
jgi:hypothetical protein